MQSNQNTNIVYGNWQTDSKMYMEKQRTKNTKPLPKENKVKDFPNPHQN